jgi:hypothetical protein
MGSVGDAYDNALCESFFATLECELPDRHRFRTQVEARLAVFDFIEGWYNPRRRHSALDYLSPMIFERSTERDDRPVTSGATIDQGGATSLSPSGRYSDALESSSPSTEPGQLQPNATASCYASAPLKDKVIHFFLNRATSQRGTSLFHPGQASLKRLIRNKHQIGIDTALNFLEIALSVR